MYQLLVFYPGDTAARHRHEVRNGTQVINAIPELLTSHGECERIEVFHRTSRLFAVDCAGNRIDD